MSYGMGGSRGGGGGVQTPPPYKLQKYRVSKQYWSGSPKNLLATKPAFNVEPSSARQRNAILMAFSWWADDGPLIGVCGYPLPSSTKKNTHKKRFQSWIPLTKLSGSAHVWRLRRIGIKNSVQKVLVFKIKMATTLICGNYLVSAYFPPTMREGLLLPLQ